MLRKETHLNFQDLKRLREIAVVFFEEGFDILLAELKLNYLLPIKYKFQKSKYSVFKKNGSIEIKKEFPKRLRKAFERLGPTFVKLGQILSVRPDILPLEYTKELEKLQANVPSFSFEEVLEILIKELKRPLHEIFLKIDPEPIGAASLAQVHRAILLTGEIVAVKVQRPQILEKIKSDIHILLYLAGLLEKHIIESRNFQPVKTIKEFADWTMRELDFRVEGKNAERMKYNFKDDKNIYIPNIYWQYSTEKVLVMELVEGFSVDNDLAMDEFGIDRKQLALNCIQAGFQMFFYDGFFHADPHPGNFVILDDSRLCLYDFGIVGYLNKKMRDKLVSIFLCYANRDIDGYVKNLLSVCEISENARLNYFAKDISQILSGFVFSKDQKSIAKSFYEVINTGAKYGVLFPLDFVLLGKSLVTIEAMGMKIYPDLDFNSELTPFVEKFYKQKFSPKNLKKELMELSTDYLSLLKNLPTQTQTLLDKLEKGSFSVKIDTNEILDIKNEIDRQNDIKILAFLTITVIIASAILLRQEGVVSFMGVSFGQMGLVASAGLMGWILILVRRK